jgi:hypothetical protein
MHRLSCVQAFLIKFAAPCYGGRWRWYAVNLSPDNRVSRQKHQMLIVMHPEPVQSQHADQCYQVLACLGSDYAPTHVILDLRNYADHQPLIAEFNDIAFTWTRDRPRDSVPQYFFEITTSPTCTHVVWLSHKAIAYPAQLFAWVFAHELRHVFQSRHQFPKDEIQRTIRALRRKPAYINLPPSLFAPEEIDSELSAVRALRALYGENELSRFLASTALPRHPCSAYTNLLREAESVISQ